MLPFSISSNLVHAQMSEIHFRMKTNISKKSIKYRVFEIPNVLRRQSFHIRLVEGSMIKLNHAVCVLCMGKEGNSGCMIRSSMKITLKLSSDP